MDHILDNIAIISSSCWLSSFQCISNHLHIDQASFGTQDLLGPSRLVNKYFGTQIARGLLQGELITLIVLVSFLSPIWDIFSLITLRIKVWVLGQSLLRWPLSRQVYQVWCLILLALFLDFLLVLSFLLMCLSSATLRPLLHYPEVLEFSAKTGHSGLSNRTIQFWQTCFDASSFGQSVILWPFSLQAKQLLWDKLLCLLESFAWSLFLLGHSDEMCPKVEHSKHLTCCNTLCL
jgi:hypothetical protein